MRMSAQALLELGMAETGGDGAGFFARNPLVRVCAGLDNFALSSDVEKTALLWSASPPLPLSPSAR